MLLTDRLEHGLKLIHFADQKEGWILGLLNLYTSSDAGATWQTTSLPYGELSGITSVGGRTFISGGGCDPTIQATTNIPYRWEVVHSVPQPSGCYVYWDIASRGPIVAAVGYSANGGLTSVSRDGGRTFTDYLLPHNLLYRIGEVVVTETGDILVAGTSQFDPYPCNVRRLTSSGTWEAVSLPREVSCLWDLTAASHSLYATTYFGDPVRTYLVASSDGGTTWTLMSMPEPAQIIGAEDGSVFAVGAKALWRWHP
jgi:hypothetical protein